MRELPQFGSTEFQVDKSAFLAHRSVEMEPNIRVLGEEDDIDLVGGTQNSIEKNDILTVTNLNQPSS